MANPKPMNAPGGGPGGPGHQQGVAFNTTNSPSRKRWKWELAIRFQLKNPNAKQTEVAKHIGVTPVTLATWQADPDFVDLQNQIMTGVLSHVDEDLAEDVTTQKLSLKRMIPMALQGLADLALQTSNPQIKLKAIGEILDRDGHLAKVTRIGLPTEAQGGIAGVIDNEVAAKLVEALQTAQAATKAQATPVTIDSPPQGGTQ